MPDWDTMRMLLEGIPALPGARCKGRCDLFERTTGESHAAGKTTREDLDDARREALRLCNDGCPALKPCTAWLDALPAAQRPRGVVAGQVIMSSGQPKNGRRPGRPSGDAAMSVVEFAERRSVVGHQGDASSARSDMSGIDRSRRSAGADCGTAHP